MITEFEFKYESDYLAEEEGIDFVEVSVTLKLDITIDDLSVQLNDHKIVSIHGRNEAIDLLRVMKKDKAFEAEVNKQIDTRLWDYLCNLSDDELYDGPDRLEET